MDRARLFFALPVDPPVRDVLGVLAGDVAQRVQGRPVAASNLHVTLAFLGSVARACLPLLQDIGSRCALPLVEAAPLALTLDRVGSFRRARVVWVGASEVPQPLRTVQSALVRALANDGFAVDERPWNPHVTLARHCRLPPGAASYQPLQLPVPALALYESVSAAGGPRYDALARWPSGGARSSSAPLSTGRVGSATHSLHDPG
jgi:2'-5' RNA ligase